VGSSRLWSLPAQTGAFLRDEASSVPKNDGPSGAWRGNEAGAFVRARLLFAGQIPLFASLSTTGQYVPQSLLLRQLTLTASHWRSHFANQGVS
jgi:hypothetical protein